MMGMHQLMRVGSSLEAFGRAASPMTATRPLRAAPATHYHSAYEDSGSGLDAFGAETIEEAKIERGRAVEWRQEAPTLGRAFGGATALVIGGYIVHRLVRR